MQRQINQNIHAVRADQFRHRSLVPQAEGVPPLANQRSESGGHFIGTPHTRIADEFKLPAIVVFEQRHQATSDYVIPQIWRYVAEAEQAGGIGIVGMRLNGILPWHRMPLVPAPLLLANHRSVLAGVVLQSEHKVTMEPGRVGLEGDGPTKGGDGLVQ